MEAPEVRASCPWTDAWVLDYWIDEHVRGNPRRWREPKPEKSLGLRREAVRGGGGLMRRQVPQERVDGEQDERDGKLMKRNMRKNRVPTREWVGERASLHRHAERALAILTGLEMRKISDGYDGGFDIESPAGMIDVKARWRPKPDYRRHHLTVMKRLTLRADWYVLVVVDRSSGVAEIIGCADRETVAAAPHDPEICDKGPCRCVYQRELKPLPPEMFAWFASSYRIAPAGGGCARRVEG